MKQSIDKKKLYIVVSVVAILLIIAITVIQILNTNKSDTETMQDSNGSTETNNNANSTNNIVQTPIASNSSKGDLVVTINNLNTYATNIPQNEVDFINDQLSRTVSLNGINHPITDAVVRDGTYNQTVIDNNNMIYQTTFIVDIPSIKQSYVIENIYSPLPKEQTGLIDYTTLVLCPASEQLIYGEFDCTDRIKEEQNNV